MVWRSEFCSGCTVSGWGFGFGLGLGLKETLNPKPCRDQISILGLLLQKLKGSGLMVSGLGFRAFINSAGDINR